MTMGYRDVVDVIVGRTSPVDLPETVCRAHRRYARRQFTWFRGMERRDELEVLDPRGEGLVDRVAALAESCA